MCTCIHYFAALFCGKYFQLFTGFAQKIIFLIYLYFVCFSLAPYWPDRYWSSPGSWFSCVHTFNHLEISKSTEMFLKTPLTFLHLKNVSNACVHRRAPGCRGMLMMALVLTLSYATNDGGRTPRPLSSSPVLSCGSWRWWQRE